VRSLRALSLWVAGLAFFVGGLVVVARGSRRAEDAFPRASIFNESPHGLSLAYGYLRDLSQRKGSRGAPVSVLSHRVGHEHVPVEAVVFRIRPRLEPVPRSRDEADEEEDGEGKKGDEGKSQPEKKKTDAEKGKVGRKAAARRSRGPLLSPAEDEWIRGGGRLVLGVADSYGPVFATAAARAMPVRKVFPLWPMVRTLVPGEATRALAGAPADEAHAIFASGTAPVVSRLLLGKGDVCLLALPEVLENAGLPRGDHLRLLVALAGEDRPVLFDEWALGLGQDEGLLDLLLAWGLGPAFVACAFALMLWFWRARTRIGPADRDPTESRSEAVDLVDSLAQLYDRALARRGAARLYREGFDKAVAARTGLRGAALSRRVDELLRGQAPPVLGGAEIPPSEFLRVLQAVNAGYRRLYEHGHSRRRV
jgi:hypothetical protein